jgi:ATP-binding cassette subfamily B protein
MKSIKNTMKSIELLWQISKGRVLHEAAASFLNYFEWLFYSSIFVRHIISAIEHNQTFYQLLGFIALTAVLFLFVSVYKSYLANVVQPLSDTYIYKKLYGRLYKKACNVELRCFEDHKFYDKYTMAVDKAEEKVTAIIKNAFTIVFGGIATVIAFTIMYQIDPFAMLFLISPLIGNFVFGTILNNIVFKRYKETIPEVRKTEYVNRVMYLSDYAKEIRLSKVFDLLSKKYKTAVDKIVYITHNYSKKAIFVHWLHTMLTFTIFQGVFLYGVYRTMISERMPFSDLSILVSIAVATTWILIGVTSAFMENINLGLYMDNLFAFLNYEEKIPENYDGIQPEEAIHTIEFENVSFGYASDKLIIDNLSFKVGKDTRVAFVGQNGAGKSTIIKLLLRLYDPCEGRILVNGIEIKRYNLFQYRQLFATALQDFKIFSFSIKENVLMGRKVENEDYSVKEALIKAGIYDKVQSLPNGADMVLSKEFDENGAVFSGGQYQKIAVARVFAQDAPVNIFDEPSSALDPIAECELYESILENSCNKIMFLISHRLSSVQNVEKIFMMNHGRLIAEGTHEELMDGCGLYKEMYMKQAQSYINETMI